MGEEPGDQWRGLKVAGELSVIGLTLVFATGIGYYLGSLVEKHWPQVAPWGGVIGGMAGVVAGFMQMYRTVRRSMRQMDEAPPGRTERDERQSGDRRVRRD